MELKTLPFSFTMDDGNYPAHNRRIEDSPPDEKKEQPETDDINNVTSEKKQSPLNGLTDDDARDIEEGTISDQNTTK